MGTDYEQDHQPTQGPQSSSTRPTRPGRVAQSGVGEAGQRQTRDQTQGIAPMARISNRIQNRVQSRIRSRIDRDYDPQAKATSPFEAAEDQARNTARPR
jgi:hypothetical protein